MLTAWHLCATVDALLLKELEFLPFKYFNKKQFVQFFFKCLDLQLAPHVVSLWRPQFSHYGFHPFFSRFFSRPKFFNGPRLADQCSSLIDPDWSNQAGLMGVREDYWSNSSKTFKGQLLLLGKSKMKGVQLAKWVLISVGGDCLN